MKLEISQTNYRITARLSDDSEGFAVVHKLLDMATDAVYRSEVNCIPTKARMSPDELKQFIELCQSALTVANWLDQNIKTPGDFSRVDVPGSIEDYK